MTLPKLFEFPGKIVAAFVTPTGKQVIKAEVNGKRHSAVRYSNGTIVETIVHRQKQ